MTAGGLPHNGYYRNRYGSGYVLSNIDDPSKLGGAIAVAFSYFYGVGSANVLWIPFGQKIKVKTGRRLC